MGDRPLDVSGTGFETLAGKYAQPERSLSESGVRRHFSRHAPEPEDSPISEAEGAPGADPAACGTEHGEELDGRAVLEASTKALTEMMDSLVREHRAVVARNPREAERILGVFMKVQGQLSRLLKERDEGRARREEFRKSILPIVQRCTSAVMKATLPLIRQNAERLREEVGEYVLGKLGAEELRQRLLQYEVRLPTEVAARMKAAMTDALAAEEAKVQG